MTGWANKRAIEVAHEQAERNGFKLSDDHNYGYEKICLFAADDNEEGVWAKDIVLQAFNNFEEVSTFFAGYEKNGLYHAAKKAGKR